MTAKSFILLAVSSALVLCSCQHELFKNGKSGYSIVISPEAAESEQYAAKELQHWIKEVSGAELPITGLDGGIKGKRLIVGFNSLAKELVPGIEQPGERDDSFTLTSCGGDLLFWGGSKRGTLYSVYSFLEEDLGCRWYSSKVSLAPHKDTWTFRNLHRHEEPGIIIRDNCYLDVRTNPAFSGRLRNNFIRLPGSGEDGTIPGTAEGYWGVHAMGHLMSPQEYYPLHPEYFSLIDGKRSSEYAQLCLSNPDVLRICTEKIKQIMRENPDYLIYSVEQNDNQRFCTCDECTALAERYGGQSGLMVWFVNQVADAVKEEFPDKFIGTFAYQYTRHAPKGIVPRDNVVIRLCSIECCMLHDYDDCEQNLSFEQDLHDWAAIAPHLYIWDYVTDFSHYWVPTPNWKTLQTHIRDFRDNHAIGILEEGDYQTNSCELRELRTWLLSKLMWNPDADVDALMKDFTDGYYGAAGPYIREYLELEERILLRPGMHTGCYASPRHEMFTDEFITEGRNIFAKAKEAVGSDQELLARVELAEYPLCLLQMEKSPIQGLENQADILFKRVVEREGLDQMSEGNRKSAKEYLASYEKLRTDYESGFRALPLLPSTEAETSGNGVAYTRYEGDFKSTVDMVRKGKVTGKGTMPEIKIAEAPETDHFGYVFNSWFMAAEDGVHMFSVHSDDGAVLLIDGHELVNIDGSHAPLDGQAMVKLQKGLHRFQLRFFDDHQDQCLDIRLDSGNGYNGPLPKELLFVPAE